MATIHIGISGWRYAPWRGDFYPKGLTQKRELQFASRAVNSIEINGSFYALQRPERYAAVVRRNARRLRLQRQGAALHHPHPPLARDRKAAGQFLCLRGAGAQGKARADPLAVPAQFQIRAERCSNISSSILPHDTEAAAALARQHDSHLHGHASMKAWRKKPLRHAVEIRNESFVDPDVRALVETLQRRPGDRRHRRQMAVPRRPHQRLSSTCACTAPKSCTPAATPRRALKRWGERIDAWHHGEQPEDAHLIAPRMKPTRAQIPRSVLLFRQRHQSPRALRRARFAAAFRTG